MYECSFSTFFLSVLSHQKEVLTDVADKPIPVIMSFDEVSLHKDIQFDQGEEKVYGPNGNAQVAMVRGLLKNFVQPVFYDFDQAMTKPILFDLLTQLDNIGLCTEGIVSDLGFTNQSLWKELEIQPGRTSFAFKNRFIKVFADIPHMLKLLRNHFLDSGLVLPSGTRFVKEDLRRIMDVDNGELRLQHKVKDIHFTCHHSQRQNVALAAQLFSHRTAAAYKFLYGEDSPQELEKAETIELINSAFDIMNSRAKEGHKQFDYGLGWTKGQGDLRRGLEEQLEVLSKMKYFIRNMRVLYVNKQGVKVPRGALLPFQKGFLVSIDSAISMRQRLKEEYGAPYLLSSRCNSDCVENFFSRIRYISGANTHPSSVDFKNRFRLVILGQSAEHVVNSAPVEFIREEEDPILLSQQLVEGVGVEKDLDMVGRSETTSQGRVEEQQGEPVEGRSDESTYARTGTYIVPTGPESSEHMTSEEALKFIAGYIAYQKRKEHPKLGVSASMALPHCPWIDVLSYGGLTKPSEEWLNQVYGFEEVFKEIHGTGISKDSNLISNLKNTLSTRFPEVDIGLIKFYSKMRIHFRIKYLRYHLRRSTEEHRNKKKAQHFAT